MYNDPGNVSSQKFFWLDLLTLILITATAPHRTTLKAPPHYFARMHGSYAQHRLAYSGLQPTRAASGGGDEPARAGILFYFAAFVIPSIPGFPALPRPSPASDAVLLEISRHRLVEAKNERRGQWSEFTALAVTRALRQADGRDFVSSRITFAHARNPGSARDLSRPAVPGRVRARHRKLGVLAKRHGLRAR